MEAVTILRELWRRRALVAVVALVSILIGLAIAYTISFPPQSRKFEVGVASGRVLVDTPDSQVVDVQPKGAGTLGIRAGVLANLMTEGDVKAAIARRAGLRPNQLRAGVEVDDELPPALTKASGDPNAHLLITSPAVNPDGTPLPMIDIQAQAPGPRDAAGLASAAVSGLNDYLDTKASGEDVPEVKRLQVTGFGAPEVREETRGPSRALALAVAIFAFVLGCAAILVTGRLARAWRVAATADGAETHAVEESASVPPASVPPASVPPASVPPASVPPASVPPASVPPASGERTRWGAFDRRARAQTAPKKLLPVAERIGEEPRHNGDELGANGDERTRNGAGRVADTGPAAIRS